MKSRPVPVRFAVPLLLAALAAGAGGQGIVLHTFNGNAGEDFGWSVAGVGDLNGDGMADVAVGAAAGRVVVFSGADGTVIHEMLGIGSLGSSIASIGDVSDPPDGVPDIAAGAPSYSGASAPAPYARVFSGATGAELYTVPGLLYERLGERIAPLGDVNADGVPDFIVGAPGPGGLAMGRAVLCSGAGGGVIRSVSNLGAGDNAGQSVAGVGDVNGDGVPDYAVGAPNDQTFTGSYGPGSVFVRSGVDDEILESYWGSDPGDAFGYTAANAGDLDGDGKPELIVGAIGVNLTGQAKTFKTTNDHALRTWNGANAGDHFGIEVAGVGDVNGDGTLDVAVASDTVGAGGAGQVKVFCGLSGAAIFTLNGAPGDVLGPVAGAGDTNGDGVVDLIVGAWGADYAKVYSLSGVGSCSGVATKLRGRIALQRSPAEPDPDASGRVELRIRGETHAFVVAAKKLDAASAFGAFVEDSAGSGVYREVGDLTTGSPTSGSWTLALEATGTAPAAVGATSLASLAGRRIELRASDGTVYLWAILPPLSGGVDVNLAGTIPATGAAPGASGTSRLQFKSAAGTSKLDLRATGLPVGPVYEVWIADGTEGGAFVPAGALVAGRLRRDTKKGDPLPAGAATAADLSGRAIEIRDGATVVLAGTLP